MIGDNINLRSHHYAPGKKILKQIIALCKSGNATASIGIGGESGSGKSTQAQAIKILLDIEEYPSVVLHMADYFVLPPKTNHKKRLMDVNNVGPDEVNLKLLNEHLTFIKNRESDLLIKPLVNYELNAIRREFLEIHDIRFVIVEGTYALLLEALDLRIFMSRNYIQTKQKRLELGRDQFDKFNERLFMIEHEIIRKHVRLANYIIDTDYNISKCTPTTSPGSHLRV